MEALELLGIAGSLGAFVAAIVQSLKLNIPGLEGRRVLLLSLGLGPLLGAFLTFAGVDVGTASLPGLPWWAAGMFLGLLGSILASGGKDLVTGVQLNAAKARQKYPEAECDTPTASSAPAASRAPVPVDQADLPPGYQPYSAQPAPAVRPADGLPATMNLLPDD